MGFLRSDVDCVGTVSSAMTTTAPRLMMIEKVLASLDVIGDSGASQSDSLVVKSAGDHLASATTQRPEPVALAGALFDYAMSWFCAAACHGGTS